VRLYKKTQFSAIIHFSPPLALSNNYFLSEKNINSHNKKQRMGKKNAKNRAKSQEARAKRKRSVSQCRIFGVYVSFRQGDKSR
jgi:hypothetical protein